uniref:Uncharacterized protein n=1 Tax=Picea sitchensis TaxID=3332 RepID=A0A6B9XU18_PICSI|nr:hypothetical protein Q903MT_gene5623 [Picea sitchensis]
MASSSAPHIHVDTGCTHSGSLWASSGLVLTDSRWRPITIFPNHIGYARCATYRSWRQRCTSFSGALSTMRSKDATIASIGTRGAPSPLYFNIKIRDA